MKRTIKISELGILQTGNTPSKSNAQYYNSADIPFVKPDGLSLSSLNVKYKDYISEQAKEKARIVKAGDILITCIGIIGKVGITNETVAFNQQITSLSVEKQYDTKYIAYNLMFNQDKLQSSCNSAVVPIINKTEFSNFEIIIETSKEQQVFNRRILDVVTNLISKKKEQLHLLDDLVKSRFVELITTSKTNDYPLVFLKDIADISSGLTPSRKVKGYWSEGQIPWVKTGELKNNYIDTTEERISDLALNETNIKILPKDTILLAMYGQGKTRGMTGLLAVEATTNQACAALVVKDRVLPAFLWMSLMYSYEKIRDLAKGGNQPNLNLNMIKDYRIILPPIDIQNKLVKEFYLINKLKSEVQKSIDETQLLMDSLMQEYFG